MSAKSLVFTAATGAIASWLFMRWMTTSSNPRVQPPKPVEQWENEGGSVAPVGQSASAATGDTAAPV